MKANAVWTLWNSINRFYHFKLIGYFSRSVEVGGHQGRVLFCREGSVFSVLWVVWLKCGWDSTRVFRLQLSSLTSGNR